MYLELSPGERWPFLHWFEGDEIVLQTPQKITVSQTGEQVTLTSPLRSSPTQHGPWPLNCQFNSLHGGLPQPAASFGFFFFWVVVWFWSVACCALRCAIDGTAGWKLQPLGSGITTLGFVGSCSLSRRRKPAQIANFCSSACKFHSVFYLVINNNTNMIPRTEGKHDKEALCKLKKRTNAQNPLANLAIMLQHRNILHFKGGRQLISLYITSMIRLCLYWSSAAVNESMNPLIVPSVFIRTLKPTQI